MITINTIEEIVFGNKEFSITNSQREEVIKSYEFLKEFSEKKVIYGINTGFGPMAQYRINDEDLIDLQYNIIRSHSVGAGKALEDKYVKAAMIARVGTQLCAKSGVHIDLVELLVKFINKDIVPYIPEHGSVGASGDLVQLAHIALTLIGEGKVMYKGKWRSSGELLKDLNIKPLDIYIREGLSVTNGTSVMTGISSINLIHSKRLLDWSILASVLMNEIASSYDDFMSETLNEARNQDGQKFIAERLRDISEDSSCMSDRQSDLYKQERGETIFEKKVQPYYSLRCVPQILGPIYETIENAVRVVENELNSASDNPIVDYKTENVYHGGNFHGDYISFEMDKLKIGITKLVMLLERQINYLYHDRINGILPPFLNKGVLGLNYGMQAAQFTATSTTAECQTLSNPMYVHSIPNNNDNQDIVSMGTNSALLTKKVIENAYQVMSIHFMSLVQAVDCLGISDKLSSKTKYVYDEIRSIFPDFIEDNPMYDQIQEVSNYLENNRLL